MKTRVINCNGWSLMRKHFLSFVPFKMRKNTLLPLTFYKAYVELSIIVFFRFYWAETIHQKYQKRLPFFLFLTTDKKLPSSTISASPLRTRSIWVSWRRAESRWQNRQNSFLLAVMHKYFNECYVFDVLKYFRSHVCTSIFMH